MTTTHRKPCEACGRSAHLGMRTERIAAAVLNGGFAVLGFLLRV